MALRAEPEHTIGRRALAAFLITVYVFLLLRFIRWLGVLIAPLLPLPALAWADALGERRALDRPVEAPGRLRGGGLVERPGARPVYPASSRAKAELAASAGASVRAGS